MDHVPELDEHALRVLFLCTANIARSPYAEHRARQMADGAALEVASAGVPGVPGRGMDAEMASQLRARGVQPDGHVSRRLTRDLLVATELVLTFEFAHRLRLVDAWPDQAVKVFGLRQFADALDRVRAPGRGLELLDQVYEASRPDGLHADFSDPHGRGTAAARAAAAEIDAVLTRIIPALAGSSSHRAAERERTATRPASDSGRFHG